MPRERQLYSASVNASASGDNTIVLAADANSKRIVVHGFWLSAAGTVSVKWRSGTTDKHAAMPMIANEKWVVPQFDAGKDGFGAGEGWFATAPGEALVLNLSAAVAVTGLVVWSIDSGNVDRAD